MSSPVSYRYSTVYKPKLPRTVAMQFRVIITQKEKVREWGRQRSQMHLFPFMRPYICVRVVYKSVVKSNEG